MVERSVLLRRIWGGSAGRPLDSAIYRIRQKLEPDPARPRWLVTTASGCRLDVDEVAPAVAAPVVGNLPPEVDARFGRDAEIAEIAERFDAGARWVVLVGPGGVGKTRLAAAVARHVDRPTWWIDLTGVEQADAAIGAVARALGVSIVGDDREQPVIRSLAASGEVLVVLDNLERLVGPEARRSTGTGRCRRTSGTWSSTAG